jgi:beta-glucosidase-like glycosyl hydrolase/CubicO group peptidase (beta-lactamase class C family)
MSTLAPVVAQNNPVVDSALSVQPVPDKQAWIDSVYNSLNINERIGQFFMVAAYSNKDEAHVKEIERLIIDYKIGGLIFMQGGPAREIILTNRYQALAKTKLLIAIDGEWGVAMRLKDSTLTFPYQLTLGAIQDNKLIERMGNEVAKQCRRLGIHVNFAPDVDVNNNPKNPVINFRSFGEDIHNVADKGVAYMKGMQNEGVMACAKHFPGHGDTDSDSHLSLPVINHNRQRLDSLEMYPFKKLIENGVGSVMAAHLFIPALDNTPQLPTSLSRKVVTGILKQEMGFKGLVFSDALNMKGAAGSGDPSKVCLMAFLAGNDVLLFAEDIPKSIELIKTALKNGDISQAEFEQRCKLLLAAKYDAGLYNWRPIPLANLQKELNTPVAKQLIQDLYANALTLAANKGNLLPFKTLDKDSFASVSIGSTKQTKFQESLSLYNRFDHYQISKAADAAGYQALLAKLGKYTKVVVGFHDMSQYASKNFGIEPASMNFLKELSAKTQVVVVIFGNPYSLKYFEGQDWVLVAYEENSNTQHLAAEVLFGARPALGKLPVTVSTKYAYGIGMNTNPLGRLQYTLPEAVGIASVDLEKVDSLALQAIKDGATPGCQILVVKNGKVIYNKAFGYHTYDTTRPVLTTDLYDLASITKVAATTIALMHQHDANKFFINRRLSEFIPALEGQDLGNAYARDVLTHYAGLRPYIPFYAQTLKDSMFAICYRVNADSVYCLKVTDKLFMRVDYKDSIINTIYTTKLTKDPTYVYSDLGFILMKDVIEDQVQDNYPNFLDTTFYAKLGLPTMGYMPTERFPLSRITPTEYDKVYRKTLVHGFVHDQGAAMMGGVGGHAGLFSSANDLAILFQMLVNRGEYAGVRYLSPTTVSEFTKQWDTRSRRGLGFDKPEPSGVGGPTSNMASKYTFGHTGFTGTGVWADPENDLIYVFLSNRVYPDAENRKLLTSGIRTTIHDAIYDAVRKANSDNVAMKQGE